jgi:hypothetical protein
MITAPSQSHSLSASPPEQRKTLDVRHTSILKSVRENRETITDLREKHIGILKNLATMKTCKPRSVWTDDDFDMFTKLSDEEYTVLRNIDEIEINSDENEYYLRTASILYDYYNIIEGVTPHQLNICTDVTTLTSDAIMLSKADDIPSNHEHSILTYFGGKNDTIPVKFHKQVDNEPLFFDSDKNKNQIHCRNNKGQAIQQSVVNDRATLLDRYIMCAHAEGPLRHLNQPNQDISQQKVPNNIDYVVCSHCRSTDYTTYLHEGCVICNECSTVEYIIVDHEKPSYKDPPKEMAYFAYKRINHLNEWLNQVQGKETTEIPEDVFISIILEIKKQKISNMATLTKKKIKDILKKLKINKYYEHIPHIMHRLNGIPTPHMTPELEDKLRHMFCLIQIPFLKYSPATRKNFLSYSYCLHKMMQLLDKDQYLDSFPLLKSREKLHQQDQIWKKICEDIGWDFIPSL